MEEIDQERQLATIETVTAVTPIEGADFIELVQVRGWRVIVNKDQAYKVGDLCIYVETDTAMPIDDPRFAELATHGHVPFKGREVHVLDTAVRRGAYSQGIVYRLSDFPEIGDAKLGDDVTKALGLEVYRIAEEDMPDQAVGPWPKALARRTEAKRVQNFSARWDEIVAAGPWTATEKIDGQSFTAVNDDGVLRVCGREWEIGVENSGAHGRIVKQLGIGALLPERHTVQGEVYGEGICGNALQVKGIHLAVFNYSIDRIPVPRAEWPAWALALAVPVIDVPFPGSSDEALELVENRKSAINPDRPIEGIVWHRDSGEGLYFLDGRCALKALSNRVLAKAAAKKQKKSAKG